MIGPGRGTDAPSFRYGTMTTQGVGTGIFYTHGHYDYATTDANLTQAAATQNFGTANEPSGVHASLIAGGPGSASGGAGLVIIEVSGASINELGVRTPGDTEIIVSDITTMALNQYFETTKKWLGTVTYTLKNADGATQTTFSADFNYGHCKYTDLGDRDFVIKSFKIEGLAGANDTGFNIRLLKHDGVGWTYAAAGFIPGNGEVVNLSDEYGPDKNLSNGENFAYDREGLNTDVKGSEDEGYIVEVTTGQNNSIQYLNAAVGVVFK
jgi:hypothetical protein